MRIEFRLDQYDLKQNFDLIIIGGGINGAGIARDAAERGLKVLLLEKNDFSSGCSSHSTRLIHGGLRYLEYLELNLVYESLQERETLLKNYPHLVNPLGLLVPAYEGNKFNLFKLNIGMWLYDWLSSGKSLKSYQKVSEEQIPALHLGIKTTALEGAVYYYDAQVPIAERLVLENIATAEARGAICLNHCEVTEIICSKTQGKYHAQGVKFKDTLNGRRPFTVYGKNIINLTGPWLDDDIKWLKEKDQFPISTKLKRRIGGTKGSHIVVKPFPGAPVQFGIYNEAKLDGRPFFILPFKLGMNDDLYLIGTTDIFLEKDGNLDKLQISEREITYLLNEVNDLFPQASLTSDSIVKTFCGVRPLPYTSKESGAAGKVTRKHFTINHDKEGLANYYSVVGGKLTTFRSLAEELVNKFTSHKCYTSQRKTLGCNYPEDMDFYSYVQEVTRNYSSKYGIDANSILHLLMIYGTNTSKVLDLTLENPLLKNKISKEFEDIEAQIVYAIRYEQAFTVEDILERRLTIGLSRDIIDKAIIKTIHYHLTEEFELMARQRDRDIEAVLIAGYSS